uniref:RNA-directed DNA polymerase, eukaryota, reverse transcriptase zinc-binding domain protein n=1 Tax=Tanacetum cinerariifolium TaxID=118510 RepID=A0A699IWZ1_TANCI|nr:RNA-directed DNA polymerase, eukaryota, reverse transcriptase zinc-binding domain protein [Tanacetum cinerariifolium]
MVSLSHLLYADDAIFIGQWSELNIDTLVQVLECFYRASGLRINMCKSKIIGVNVKDGKIQNAASKLRCLVLKTPFTYLGTKVGENMSRKEAWKEVVDKVLSRLSKWKTKTISIGDKDVIVGGQTCWTSIVKEARSLKCTGINVVDLIRLKLGNGDSSSFWEDKWYAGGVIKELFPRLYALELHKHATVRIKLMAPSLDNSFRRRVRSGVEESQFNSVLEIVQVINLVSCEDRYFWSLESEGDYSVASIRKLIDEKRFQDVGISTRWVKSAPTAWKIKTNALPTRFNLSQREMDIDTLMCPVRKCGVETTIHLFFQCVLSKQIMRKVSYGGMLIIRT